MEREVLKELLDALYDRYDTVDFIADDPVSVPHMFTRKEDREIAGFLAATVAWGNRRAIVRSGRRMMELMDDAPYDFTMDASGAELDRLRRFVQRTAPSTATTWWHSSRRCAGCVRRGAVSATSSSDGTPQRAICVACWPSSGASSLLAIIPCAARNTSLPSSGVPPANG